MLIHCRNRCGRSVRIYTQGLLSGNFFHFQKCQKNLFFGYKPRGFNAREYSSIYRNALHPSNHAEAHSFIYTVQMHKVYKLTARFEITRLAVTVLASALSATMLGKWTVTGTGSLGQTLTARLTALPPLRPLTPATVNYTHTRTVEIETHIGA